MSLLKLATILIPVPLQYITVQFNNPPINLVWAGWTLALTATIALVLYFASNDGYDLSLVVESGEYRPWNFSAYRLGKKLGPGIYPAYRTRTPGSRLPVIAIDDKDAPGDIIGEYEIILRQRAATNSVIKLIE